MSYHVQVTSEAEKDIFAALDYIEGVLYNRKAAADLSILVEQTILSLDVFPHRHPLCNDKVLQAYGVRYVPVKNYILLYSIDESRQQVNILAFVFGKRQWQALIMSKFKGGVYEINNEACIVHEAREPYGKKDK
ncbi:MAG: type II toxin-antitoxin system RelE/ParE family toxin [Phascolarctobacterium sp.]